MSGSDAPEAGTINDLYPKPDTETLKETGQPPHHPQFAPPPISGQHKIENAEPTQPKRRKRGLVFWLLIALVLLVILGIALGVGLGVGLTRNNGSKSRYESFPNCWTAIFVLTVA